MHENALERPKKVGIIGGTGRVGGFIVQRCLAKGYHVVAYARKPEKIETWAKKCEGYSEETFTVVEGDAADKEAMARLVDSGCDTILSALGCNSKARLIVGPGMETLASVLKEREKTTLPKVIFLSSHAVGDSRKQTRHHGCPCGCCGCMGCCVLCCIIPCMIGSVIWEDMEAGEEALKGVEGLNLVITRPANMVPSPGHPGLTDEWVEEHKDLSDEYLALEPTVFKSGGCMGPWIPRPAIARFMVDAVESSEWDGHRMTLYPGE